MQPNAHENNKRIIVVEDDEGLNSLISKKLERFGFEVKSYTKGCKAVDAFNRKDLILLDYKLQNCYAEEIIYELQEKTPNPKFIIMTGQGDEKTAVKMMKMGAKDYITKDVNFLEKLPSVISKVLNLIDVEEKLEESQKELKKSEEKYRLITENVNDLITKLDLSFKCSYVSTIAEKLTGYKSNELLGKSIFDFVHPNEKISLKNYFERILQGSDDTIIRYRFRKKNGEYIWLEANNHVLKTDKLKNKEIISVSRDITEVLKSEELIKAKEAAEYASKTKSEFLANLSHEIRNPMNVIIGMTNTLSRTQINQEQTKYIEALRISSNNLMNIINDILDISKIEANKVDIYNIHFKLDELFNELKLLYQHQADFKGLDFQYKIAPNVPLHLVGDYNKLKQILVNLISNAIKFTKKGSVSLLAELVLIEKKSVKIKFIVQDTGIGIKKENFNKIFEAFTQLDSSWSKQYSGTGLGLAIVKKFTDLLSGNITFNSKYNKGTTFYVQIPFHLFDKSVTKNEEEQKKINKKQPIKEMKILLAEDDAINQMYLKNFLENQGWQVETAKNGLQVIDKFKNETYDLILMDGQMPKMDGFEATRIIRSKEQENQLKHIPIIAITGYAVSEEKDKFLNAGMDEFITKPINEQKLLNIIDAVTSNT